MVEIEIDGKQLQVPEGSTIIEAADEAGIYIPRFCYHRKLSIAANCRMCLVEVEKSKKPLPACATPVTAGMKVMTRSPMALKAQRDVMEFLLINHPLDCPICDQGGECELQDLSQGFGRADSRYTEAKRSVASEDIGPLIETWMTRCIHCTRCVRFGEEIAGLREMGMTYRGEHSEIGTYVKHFLKSELSGNIIDICPVGALTNKPARYQGRGWEYREHATVSPHDAVGTHLFVHSMGDILDPRRKIMRAVPRECEAINETWCSDRDRYSVHGLYHESRVYKPRVKRNNQWQEVEWQVAIDEIADRTRQIMQYTGPQALGALASSNSTVEELYLLQKMLRALGSNNVDHRLREQDFSDQEALPLSPTLNLPIADIEQLQTIVLIGSNIRFEQPLLAHRITMAAEEGAEVIVINPMDYSFTFPVSTKIIVNPLDLPQAVAGVTRALADLLGEKTPELNSIKPCDTCQLIANKLQKSESVGIFLGEAALTHGDAASIRTLTHLLQRLSQAKVGVLTAGANGAGAWLAGMVPHRGPAGQALEKSGLTAKEMLTTHPRSAYFLLNTEPEFDAVCAASAVKTLTQADLVVCLTPFISAKMEEYADVILPIAPFTETAGTFVNVEGRWQSFAAATEPFGDSKPAWKVLRVLATFLELPHFEYQTAHEVQFEIKRLVENNSCEFKTEERLNKPLAQQGKTLQRLTPWPIYRSDNLVRRSLPLQEADHDALQEIAVNSTTAAALGLQAGVSVTARQADSQVTLTLKIDDRLPDNTVLLAAGLEVTAGFGTANSPIELARGL